MEIVIMRHGEPDVPTLPNKVNSTDFFQCLEIYKSCGIAATSKPEAHMIDLFRDFKAIVCSDLKRSVESAALLAPHNDIIVDPMYREIEDSFMSIPFIKLAPRTWGNIFILLWFLGAFEHKKAFREGKARAKNCATKLAVLAEEYGKVLFVGHGFINTYVAKELNRIGWDGPKLPGKRYWDYAIYNKHS